MSADLLELLTLETVALAEAVPDVAGPAHYASPAEEMLALVMEQGGDTLLRLARRAVRRYLEAPGQCLFTDAERQELAEALAATQATATFLGRSLVADHAA